MKEFTVGPNDGGQRLDRFLSKIMPGASQGLLYKSLRKKRIKINGKRVTDGAIHLQEGDFLEVYCNDEYFIETSLPLQSVRPLPLSVVYEDQNIIIMHKPSGLLAQGESGVDSLEARMRGYLLQKGEYQPQKEYTFVPSLCHRIDRNTAGLVIGAKNAESLRLLNQKIRDREIRKYYLCETEGTPIPETGEISGWLTKDEKHRKMLFWETPRDGATPCHTRYRVLRPGKTALVEAELLTGRTHQIRAGFSHLGYPLLGDVKYGAQKNGSKEFQHLTAYRLVFSFTTDAGCLAHLQGKEIQLPKEDFL